MATITRNSNPLIFIPPLAVGSLVITVTIVAAILLKPGIEARVGKPLQVQNVSRAMQIESLDRQIKSRDDQIQAEHERPDHEKRLNDAKRKLDELTGKKPLPDSTDLKFEQEKAANIKRYQDEKAQLTARRDETAAQISESKHRSWAEWLADFEIGLVLRALLPLGVLSFIFVRLMFFAGTPKPNPLSLTDLEKRSILFFVTSLVVSAFGFFLFVWALSVRSNLWG